MEAWHKAQAAQAQVQTTQAQVSQANQAASTAAGTYNQAVTTAMVAPPDPTGATLVHLSSLQTAYQNASNQLATANSALAAANANLQAAHALADSARSQAKAAARHVAAGLHKASNAGIHNPHHSHHGGFLHVVDDLGGTIGTAWHAGTKYSGKAVHYLAAEEKTQAEAIKRGDTPIGKAEKYVRHQFEMPRNWDPNNTPLAKGAHETAKLAAKALPATARYLGRIKNTFEGCAAGGAAGAAVGFQLGVPWDFEEATTPAFGYLGCAYGAGTYNYAPGYEIPTP